MSNGRFHLKLSIYINNLQISQLISVGDVDYNVEACPVKCKFLLTTQSLNRMRIEKAKVSSESVEENSVSICTISHKATEMPIVSPQQPFRLPHN